MLTLDIAISTYKPEGIKRVENMLLSPQPGVRYIISWQEHKNTAIPDNLHKRDDVEIYRLDVKGLSNNRNNAIEHCSADIILIADDDLQYETDAFIKIIKTFESLPQLDLALFKADYSRKKNYPEHSCRIKLPFPKNYYVSSIEIAFRRSSLKDLRFWSQLGLGNDLLGCGEDEFFVISAVNRKLDCRFINETICSHPGETTGGKLEDSVLRGAGFITRVIYPKGYILRLPLKAYRSAKSTNGNYFRILRELFRGAQYSKSKFREIPENCKW